MQAVRSELAYFTPQFLETEIHREFVREFTPISALQQGCPIEFNIPGADLLYNDFSKSYLYTVVCIQKPNGDKPSNTDDVGVVNLTAHALFSQLDVEIGGKMVSDANSLYPYRSYFETLLSFDKNAQETELQKSMWFKDTADKIDTFNSLGQNALNLGLKARSEYFNAGAEVELIGRPHADIFNQQLALPSNIATKLRFIPSRDDFVLVTPAPQANAEQVKYKVKIVSAKMFIYTLEVNPSLENEITRHLQRQNIVIPLIRGTMKYLSIASAQSAVLYEGLFRGQLPDRVVMAMAPDPAMTGGYQENPFSLKDHGLNYLVLNVNGENLPNRPFTPDFTHKKYLREYYSMFEGLEIQNSSRSINISREEYGKGYTLFVFDLRAGPNSSPAIAATKTGHARLELKFTAPTSKTINCIVYAEFNTFIEIDKYRNLITPF